MLGGGGGAYRRDQAREDKSSQTSENSSAKWTPLPGYEQNQATNSKDTMQSISCKMKTHIVKSNRKTLKKKECTMLRKTPCIFHHWNTVSMYVQYIAAPS